jgi:hypothetical protein
MILANNMENTEKYRRELKNSQMHNADITNNLAEFVVLLSSECFNEVPQTKQLN